MNTSIDAVRQFKFLLIYNIETFYGGKQVDFIIDLDERLEDRFQLLYKTESMNRRSGKYWVSQSTLSRWLTSTMVAVQIQMLSFLGETKILKFPPWVEKRGDDFVTTNDLLEILLGKLEIDIENQTEIKLVDAED